MFGWSIDALFRIASVIPAKYSTIVLFPLPFKPYLSPSDRAPPATLLSLSLTYLILPLACLSILSAGHVAASLLLSSSLCHPSILNGTLNCTSPNLFIQLHVYTTLHRSKRYTRYFRFLCSSGCSSHSGLSLCSRSSLAICYPLFRAGLFSAI